MSDVSLGASVELQIPFHDCDPLGVSWHGRYLSYFEAGRTALFRRYQMDVPQIREMGFRMYVTDARCRYLFPLAYGECAKVTAWFTDTRPLLRVAYTVDNLTHGRRSARGYTVLATTDAEGKLLTSTPDELLALLPI